MLALELRYNDSGNGHSVEKIKVHNDPAVVYRKLVENGIFSLNGPPPKVNYGKYPELRLTKNGFNYAGMTGVVMDGVSYLIQYKVDTLFDELGINNPEVHYNLRPDIQTIRRRYEITEAMLSFLQ